jgi:hypothetical protein
MRLVLDRIEEQQSGSTKLKQFAGDLANTLKSTYETKIRPGAAGGIPGAGKFSSSLLGSLGFGGLAESVKQNAEAKEAKRQEKEKFVGNFQQYSEAGKTLSADTSRNVAESLYDEIDAKTKELKKLQEEADKQKKAGYGEDPENQKKQEELLKAIQAIDPRNKEKGASDKDIQAVQADEAKIETAEKAKESFEVAKKQQDDVTALYTITDDHFKKQDKYNEDSLKLLEQISINGLGGGGAGGGLLDSAAEMAGDLMGDGKKGGKGRGKLGKLGKVGKFLTGNAGKIAGVGAGLLSVGTAAYEGYSEYNEADEKVKSGEITKEEGQVDKGKAVGGAVGGGAGGWAGASAGASTGALIGTMIMPGVGTVVGGALGGIAGGMAGYWGGKKVGQAVGGGAVKGYQALGGNDPNSGAMENVDAMGNPTGMSSDSSPPANSSDPKKNKLARDWAWSIMTEQAGDKKPDASIKDQVDTIIKTDTQLQAQAKKYLEDKKAGANKIDKSQKVAKVEQQAEKISPDAGATLAQRTGEVEDARSASQNNSSIVNAPQSSVTNITNNNGGGKESKPSARNDESTYQRYLDRRYYPMRDF